MMISENHPTMPSSVSRTVIKHILINADRFEWTVQGFGMLRTYLDSDKRFRLNVWHAGLAVPKVSMIHDHPWSFDSWIVNGEFYNIRMVEDHFNGEPYEFATILCGITSDCQLTKHGRIRLFAKPAERYVTGDTYSQAAEEIHMSVPMDGSVTLNDRRPLLD